jgi:hypothetical protein
MADNLEDVRSKVDAALAARRKDSEAKPESKVDDAMKSAIADAVRDALCDAGIIKRKDAKRPDAQGDDEQTEDERREGEGDILIGKAMDKDKENRADAIAGLTAFNDPRFADVQARADAALSYHGKKSLPPLVGESLLAYRKRLVKSLQSFSPDWKGVDIRKMNADAMDVIENRVFADAISAAESPETVAIGALREIRETDDAGRVSTRFVGRWSAAMQPFMRAPMKARFNRKPLHE